MAWVTTKDGRHVNTEWFEDKEEGKKSSGNIHTELYGKTMKGKGKDGKSVTVEFQRGAAYYKNKLNKLDPSDPLYKKTEQYLAFMGHTKVNGRWQYDEKQAQVYVSQYEGKKREHTPLSEQRKRKEPDTIFEKEYMDKVDKYREKFLTKRTDEEIAEIKKNLDTSSKFVGTTEQDMVAYKAIEDEMARRKNKSKEIDEDKLTDIAARYNTSNPVSGSWDTETEHEQKAISKEFGISMDEAKQVMIDKLGFDEDDKWAKSLTDQMKEANDRHNTPEYKQKVKEIKDYMEQHPSQGLKEATDHYHYMHPDEEDKRKNHQFKKKETTAPAKISDKSRKVADNARKSLIWDNGKDYVEIASNQWQWAGMSNEAVVKALNATDDKYTYEYKNEPTKGAFMMPNAKVNHYKIYRKKKK